MSQRLGRLPREITGAPLRTVRPMMLRGFYANPEKELARMARNCVMVRLGHGTYMAKPDNVSPNEVWKPPFEEAAMGYATAAYGERIPILAGLGAARWYHAIPRAIAVTVIAVPTRHNSVTLATGGRVVFIVRRVDQLDAVVVRGGVGRMLVTTLEQTLIDLVRNPELGGLRSEAEPAIDALADRVDSDQLSRLLARLPRTVAANVRARLGESRVRDDHTSTR